MSNVKSRPCQRQISPLLHSRRAQGRHIFASGPKFAALDVSVGAKEGKFCSSIRQDECFRRKCLLMMASPYRSRFENGKIGDKASAAMLSHFASAERKEDTSPSQTNHPYITQHDAIRAAFYTVQYQYPRRWVTTAKHEVMVVSESFHRRLRVPRFVHKTAQELTSNTAFVQRNGVLQQLV